ncbi:MAG: hypothetical protein ABW168_08190 [Sedimenticola sp.]
MLNWTDDWTNDGADTTESDPGKDLFAVLFLSFFLISVLLMMSASPKYNGVSPGVTSGGSVVINAPLARLVREEGVLYLKQSDKRWRVPEQMQILKEEVQLNQTGEGKHYLTIDAPGQLVGVSSTFQALLYLEQQQIPSTILVESE